MSCQCAQLAIESHVMSRAVARSRVNTLVLFMRLLVFMKLRNDVMC